MIRAIIFDYFDVLVYDTYWHTVVARAKQKNAMDELFTIRDDLNLGRSGWQLFCERIGSIMGVDAAAVADGYEQIELNSELIDYLEELKTSYDIALLSNAEKTQLMPQLKRKNIDILFDVIGISSEFGMIKPEPTIYTQFALKLGLQPAECVMIDDNADNVMGAKAAGLNAIRFINNGQLKHDLQSIVRS